MSNLNPVQLDDAQFNEMQELFAEDFVALITEYLNDTKQRLHYLQEAVDTGEHRVGFDIAHTQKGASANIGANLLSTLCHEMQEACREEHSEQQHALLPKIQAEAERSHEQISQRLAQL